MRLVCGLRLENAGNAKSRSHFASDSTRFSHTDVTQQHAINLARGMQIQLELYTVDLCPFT